MNDNDASGWPTVVELIGNDLATQLSAALGGTRVYVPRYAGPAHPLTQAVGERAAALIVSAMAREELLIPIALGRDARIVQLHGAGDSIDKIALAVGCSRRTVQYVLARHREDEPEQLDLFG